MEKSGPSTYTLNISPVLKETVDDAFDEIVSSVTDDSDCYDAIQDEMHLGPFSGHIPLKNVGAIYIAKGLSIICEENRSSLVSKLNHVNLSNHSFLQLHPRQVQCYQCLRMCRRCLKTL